jgi:hypothetical protein
MISRDLLLILHCNRKVYTMQKLNCILTKSSQQELEVYPLTPDISFSSTLFAYFSSYTLYSVNECVMYSKLLIICGSKEFLVCIKIKGIVCLVLFLLWLTYYVNLCIDMCHIIINQNPWNAYYLSTHILMWHHTDSGSCILFKVASQATLAPSTTENNSHQARLKWNANDSSVSFNLPYYASLPILLLLSLYSVPHTMFHMDWII